MCSSALASLRPRTAASLRPRTAWLAPLLLCCGGVSPAQADDDFWSTLTGGKLDVTARYRYETVDDNQLPTVRRAGANTLRTAVGYSTPLLAGWGAYVQIEDVRALGTEHYSDGGRNGATRRATIVDPEGTELQQASLRYRGFPRTQITFGRQEIDHRASPLNRFAGSVAWRQNVQSMDALRVVNDQLPGVKIDYAYVWNVNRIFGEDNRLPDRSDFNVSGNLLDITYSGIANATLEPYLYRLNFDTKVTATRALSTTTYGARLQGSYDVISRAAKLLYVAEAAHQQDFGSNPLHLSVGYYMVEFGATQLFNDPDFESMTVKLSYELLEGSGRVVVRGTGVPASFQTPLGTNHAFQGWADRFLTTPADGVKDAYATLAARAFGTNFTVTLHRFDADHDNYSYGSEWDIQATRVFADHYTAGVKYARYDVSDNSLNRARNGQTSAGKQAFDSNKLWLWGEIRF